MLKSKRPLHQVIEYGKDFLEVPYIWGGNSFLLGLDCSAFCQHLALYMGFYDRTDRTCKHFKRFLISKGGILGYEKKAGSFLFYGTEHGKETHVAFAISDKELIESGGAGSKCHTRVQAKKLNAKVRIKPINHRTDFLYSVPVIFKESIMSEQDTDKVELLAEGINDLVEVGEKVLEDGKVNFADMQHLPELGKAIEKFVKAGKARKEILEEIKDMDSSEAMKVLAKLLG